MENTDESIYTNEPQEPALSTVPASEAPQWRSPLLFVLVNLALVSVLALLIGMFFPNLKNALASREAAEALITFQHDYLTFADYYTSIEWVSTRWYTRLAVFFIPTLLLFSVLMALGKKLMHRFRWLNRLFNWTYAIALLLVMLCTFYFPQRICSVNTSQRSFVITEFSYLHLPRRYAIPFAEASHLSFAYESFTTGRNRSDRQMVIYLHTLRDEKILIAHQYLPELSQVNRSRRYPDASRSEVRFAEYIIDVLQRLAGMEPKPEANSSTPLPESTVPEELPAEHTDQDSTGSNQPVHL